MYNLDQKMDIQKGKDYLGLCMVCKEEGFVGGNISGIKAREMLYLIIMMIARVYQILTICQFLCQAVCV